MNNKFAAFIGMGAEMIALMLLGVYLGGKADQAWSLSGLGMGLGVLLALILWFIHLMIQLKSLDNNKTGKDT